MEALDYQVSAHFVQDFLRFPILPTRNLGHLVGDGNLAMLMASRPFRSWPDGV